MKSENEGCEECVDLISDYQGLSVSGQTKIYHSIAKYFCEDTVCRSGFKVRLKFSKGVKFVNRNL